MPHGGLLKLDDDQYDLDLVVDGRRFRTHTAVLCQDSDLIRSWLQSPLLRHRDAPIALRLQLPEIRLPSCLQPPGSVIDPRDVFRLYLELAYFRHQHQSYALSLCYNHGIAAVCHHLGYDSVQFGALAVLADFLFTSKLKEACDVFLSFAGGHGLEQLQFARRYSLRRLFDKTIRALIVHDPDQLQSLLSGVLVDDITAALERRDAWHRDQCFRFSYLVRLAARLNLSATVFERKLRDDALFRVWFTDVDRLRLLLRWCQICHVLWDPLDLIGDGRARTTLDKIRVDECIDQLDQAEVVLNQIRGIMDDAQPRHKATDRTAVKLEF